MKKIILLSLFLALCASKATFAQLEGKRFISGAMSLNLGTTKTDTSKSSNGYSYGVNIGLGKFKSANRASGWIIKASINGGKQYEFINGEPRKTVDGISGFSVGTGYFWEYYKHFNEKFGIYGGPGFDVSYSYSKSLSNDISETIKGKTNVLTASLNLRAGAYYRLNDKWWLLASLAISEPASVGYSFQTNRYRASGTVIDSNRLTYKFSPDITLPSVSLGLRYFLKDR